jgi:thiamine-phosphate pyrophosphorylase
MRGLYPIVDVDTLVQHGICVEDFANRVLTARPSLLQLRAKHASSRETLNLVRFLKPACEATGTLLFLNDRVDLALVGECDGVHVGQEDLCIGDVHRIAPALKVGVSTHTLEQLDSALQNAPDYVAFGPVFPTVSKVRPDPVVGLELLEVASRKARARGRPIVAIGGIDEERATAVGRLGALGAVIGALVPASGLAGVADRAALLHARLGGRT